MSQGSVPLSPAAAAAPSASLEASRAERPCPLPSACWAPLVDLALAEDLGTGDLTSQLCIGPELEGRAVIEAREALVVCGLWLAEAVFARVDPGLRFEARTLDGTRADPGQILGTLDGRVHAILSAERTALNFLQRMSGVATHTRRFVEAAAGTAARIVDTRKTLPGWRALDKYAVATGGGVNHRIGLFDGILIKDNHVAAAGGVAAAVKAALAGRPAHVRVQVEVESEEQAEEAVVAGADFLLLDNLKPERIRGIVQRYGERVTLEASGGVHLENLRAYAETGVHRISIGALTHSAPAADLALEIAHGGVAG